MELKRRARIWELFTTLFKGTHWLLKTVMRLPALRFTSLGVALFLSVGNLHAAGFADHLVLGDGTSEKKHRLQIQGSVAFEELTTSLGATVSQYPVRTLSGTGSALGFQFQGAEPGKPGVLEIEEIHNRRPDAFGYTVLVNDREIYFRSYQELGTGPNHFFIQLPAELMRVPGPLRVTCRNEGNAPFSIGQVWLYSDFFNHLAKKENVYRPMGFYIEISKAFPGLKPPAEQWERYKQTYSGLQCYAPPGAHISMLSYAAADFSKLKGEIDQSLDLLGKTGMGAQFLFNATAWGGAMKGPDGRGGYFSDMQYSQVSVNPVTGAMNPSYPNMWGNSMNTTYANAHYNRTLQIKFDRLVKYFADRIAFLTAEGALPPEEFHFARELGIDYINYGDFHPDYIKAAAQEGVHLDPRDGLDMKERQWMFNNISRIFDWMGKDFARSLGRNPVRVDRGKLQLPSQQYTDNLFGHAVSFLPLNVLRSKAWYGWQTGVTDQFWSSGEHGRGDVYLERIRDDYLRSRGKLTMINRERHGLKQDFSYSQNLYQQGYLYQAFYDTHPKDKELFRACDRIDEEPSLAPVHCEPNCLDMDLNRDLKLGTPEQIVSVENLRAHETPCGHHANKMVVQELARPGTVLYRLTNRGTEFPSGLSVSLMGRIAAGDGNWIEIAAGPSPESLKIIQRLQSKDLPYPEHWTIHQTSETTLSLGEDSRGRKEYYLQLSLHSQKAFDATFLHELRVGMTWARKSGQLAGRPFTCRQSRILNLWTQDRAVTQRLLRNYRTLGGEDSTWHRAQSLYDEGYYRSACSELVGEYSQLLPARYAVRGHGKLGKHPVSVKLGSENGVAIIDLEKLANSSARFGVKTQSEEALQITFSELRDGGFYQCKPVGENQYEITDVKTPDAVPGTMQARNGSVVFDLKIQPAEEKGPDLPRNLSGIYLSGNPTRIRVELGDLKMTDYKGSIELPVAKHAIVSRSAECLQAPAGESKNWPQPNDRVDITLDEAGQVIGLNAFYGLDRGRIKSFTPPSFEPPCDGVIELENGHRFELTPITKCDTVFLHSSFNQYEVAKLPTAFKPGEPVEIAYSPYTYGGRLPRLLDVKQPYTVLLDEDYQTMSGAQWKKNPVAIEGAVWETHALDPSYMPDYTKTVLYPSEAFNPGWIVYKIEQKEPLQRTMVECMGRLFEDSTRVEFFVSGDQIHWTKCGQFDNSFLNYMALKFPDRGPWNFFDLSDDVQGRKLFYLKVQLTRHADDHRFGLARLRVVSASPNVVSHQ